MCAVIKRGILGGFQNKIANVVGSSWKGIATMRSLPISVANPRTAPQVTQRNKFSNVSKVGSQLLTAIIKPLWDRFAQQESGFNAFIRRNIAFFNSNGIIDANNLIISEGVLAVSEITDAVADISDDTLAVTWVINPAGDSLGTDRAYIAYWDLDADVLTAWADVGPRSAGTATVSGNGLQVISGNTGQVYLAFKRVDGTKVSNTSTSGVTPT